MSIPITAELSSKVFSRRIPLDVTWEITKKCNHRCKPCYVAPSERSELSLERGLGLIKDLSRAKTLYLTFTGGEPFTRRRELKTWAFAAQASGLAVIIFTNGTLVTGEDIRWLKELTPFAVHISVFAADPGKHDLLTGVRGSHARSLGAIRALRNAGISVVMKMLLMKHNFSERKKVRALAGELDAAFHMDPLETPGDSGSYPGGNARLSREEITEVIEETSRYTIDRFKAGTSEDLLCGAGATMAAISAQGDVYPCLMYPHSAGSIKNRSFTDIWEQSALLKKIRNLKPADIPKCNSCVQVPYCSRCPGLAMLEDEDEFGPSSTSCMFAEITNKLTAAYNRE